MRLGLLILIMYCGSCLAAPKDPILINEQFDRLELKQVFKRFKKKYGLKIAFSERLVSEKLVTVDLREKSIAEAFEIILDGTGLSYEYIRPNAVIIKKGGPSKPTFDLIGEVYDQQSGERLPFALIRIAGQSGGTTSNEDGIFTVKQVTDTSQLEISYLGYASFNRKIESVDRKSRLLIPMQATFENLEMVTVAGMQDQVELLHHLSRVAFDPGLVADIPTSAEKDVFRMMQLIPGVTATNELQSGLEVNGGNANQNVITFDGFRVYHMDHFFGYFSAINPYAVKSMRLFKTGFDARYGGSASSVMEFTGKDGNNASVSGRFSINPLSVNTSLEAPISGNTTMFFSGRRSYSDLLNLWHFNRIFRQYEQQVSGSEEILTLVSDVDYEPEFTFGDLNFKISTKPGPKDLLSWSVYNSNDLLNFENSFRLEYPGDSLVDVDNLGFVKWGNFGTSLRFSRLWDDANYTDLLVSYSKYGSEFSEKSTQQIRNGPELTETQSSEAIQDNGIEDISLNVEHEWSNSEATVVVGAQNSLYRARINSETNGETFTKIEQNNVLLLTQFIDMDFSIIPRLAASLGLRSNYLSSRNQVYLEPRSSLSFQVNDNLSFATAAGIYTQFVNQINTQNVLQGSRDLWTLADEDIPVQIATHFISGISYSRSAWSMQLNFFQKQFSGIMDYAFRNGNLITEYENYEQQFFEGDGRARGVEAFIKHESGQFTGWMGYTLSKVDYRFEDIDEGDWYTADHDQRHEINLLGAYKAGAFRFQATWLFGSGRPFTIYRLNDRRNNNRRGDRPGVALLEAEGRNTRRLTAYHRLDVGVTYTYPWGKSELQINANAFNLYNRINIYGRTLRMEVNRTRPNSPDDGPGSSGPTVLLPRDYVLMGFTPSLSVELRF